MLENRIIKKTQESKTIICIYQNKSPYLQIVKIENATNFYWKNVFPWQNILFNAVEQAELAIYSNSNATTILTSSFHGGVSQTDTIACLKLRSNV